MLNKLAKEIHQNAVDHGWWETEREFGGLIALMHSELSEALEEYRNGREPNAIYLTGPGGSGKPEGIPVELADCIIRILDYCGKEGIDIEEAIRINTNTTKPARTDMAGKGFEPVGPEADDYGTGWREVRGVYMDMCCV